MNSIADNFLKNASLFADKNAIFIDNKFYTYTEVKSIVFSIYEQLKNEDQKIERIGVLSNNDIFTYCSILAISIYGAAFVPLNNKFPIEKNTNIIENANLELILYSKNIELDKQFTIYNFLKIDDSKEFENIFEYSFTQIVTQPLAYILYTSGTTSQPKGVPISHDNIESFFTFFKTDNAKFNFNENDRFIQIFELTFDVFVLSFFMPLHYGACCYILPQKGIKNLEIVKMMSKHEITVAPLVPTILQYLEKYLDEIDFPKLRYSIFCGDKLMNRVAEKWASKTKNAKLYNCYGPTETTIICTYYLWEPTIDEEDTYYDIVTFGKNFTNVQSLLIDDLNQINPIEGELCFHGNQIITKYLNNTNTDKFIQINDLIYYKTGDLVKINKNGNYLFLGRTDNQVKINGHRVEINEIEETIRKLTDSKFTIIPNKDENELIQLILFIENEKINSKIHLELKNSLPHYMVPQTIIYIDKLPLNLNNKYDHALLIDKYINPNTPI